MTMPACKVPVSSDRGQSHRCNMQGATRQRAAAQRAQLDALAPLAADTQALLLAAADTEPVASAKVKKTE